MEDATRAIHDNRSLLLARSCKLFSERGYDAVGVQELSTAAGVSKPTLYHYFENKLGLLRAIVDENGTKVLGAIKDAAMYQGDLPLTLERLAFAFRSLAREQAAFYRLILALHFTPPEHEAHQVSAALMDAIFREIEAMFLQAVVQHGNLQGRHRAHAFSFLGLVHSLVGMELQGSSLEDHELRRMIQWYQYGIYS